MSEQTQDQMSPTGDDDFRFALEAQLERHFISRQRIFRIERRPSPYRTSFALRK